MNIKKGKKWSEFATLKHQSHFSREGIAPDGDILMGKLLRDSVKVKACVVTSSTANKDEMVMKFLRTFSSTEKMVDPPNRRNFKRTWKVSISYEFCHKVKAGAATGTNKAYAKVGVK